MTIERSKVFNASAGLKQPGWFVMMLGL